jgi:hypothetical protein
MLEWFLGHLSGCHPSANDIGGSSQVVVHADTLHEFDHAVCFSNTNEQIRGVPAIQIHSLPHNSE